MVNAKEFRIGNILLCAKRDIPYRVTAEDILVIDDGSSKSRPVPLTEEILLKCPQFKHNPIVKVATVFNVDLGRGRELTVSCVGTPNLAIFITNKENGKTTDIVTIWNYDYDKELYLHTFQNLIHSLTNTELTVNL